MAGLTFALAVRYDLSLQTPHTAGLKRMAALAAAIQLTAGFLFHLYRRRYRFGSFEEVTGLFLAAFVTTGTLFVVDVSTSPVRPLPASVTLAGGMTALVLMTAVRYGWRLLSERVQRPNSAGGSARLLVFGAGRAGAQIVDAMLRDRATPYLPVALLDDDPSKRNLRIRGVRVAGGRDALATAARKFDADTVLLAIPSGDAALIRLLTDRATAAGLEVKVLPAVREMIDGRVEVSDIRDLNLADLLGRRQVETDLGAIAHYLTGRRVLVTGAGGSIGAELCRQLHQLAPSELIMLDRDESGLHAVQLSIHGKAMLDSDEVVLADIRDIAHITDIFEQRRPEVVFHAAALKHLPLLEQFPGEAVKSNVWGTLNVLQAAAHVGVTHFVNISTDKAANPESVLGYSKRMAERLTADVAETAEGSFLSVRFGNVLGSRGSVLTAFASQIGSGGPVTVTHPDVTRYFMTVQEAVQLVIQAGAIGRDGEVLVLDMGDPVRIADVARQLISQSPRPVSIVYTGLRPGEKLHEDLLADDENDERPLHPLITQVPVPPLAPVQVLGLDAWSDREVLITELVRLTSQPRVRDLDAQRGH